MNLAIQLDPIKQINGNFLYNSIRIEFFLNVNDSVCKIKVIFNGKMKSLPQGLW